MTTKGSMYYVWDTQKNLGHGATSMVYLGRCKKTFETVAVKVFNPASYNRPVSIQMREFEVMRKLNHKNIVKLLSIEEENKTYCKVIVMEYCPYGSLFSMLEEPENANGMSEEEVLLVIQHVANGMKHLRDNAIVHRDVKPGNILRCKDPDGRSVYKLTDFGAARELEDEEHFVSLYGTEEYLHPHVYERAVLRRSNSKLFDASVDLWSIGVTYYHMATGSLPFKPFGGRRNKELMHEIVSQKDSGVISGVQTTEGGPINWSKQLPDTCQLSRGLKLYFVPLLAALFEINGDKIWPFEKYFEAVDKMCSKRIIHAFCPSICHYLKIYIDKDKCLTSLTEHVTIETGIKEENQLILFDNRLLDVIVDPKLTIENYPDYITPDNPIFIFNKVDEFFAYPDPHYITLFSQFTESMYCNYDVDYRIAKLCCKTAHAVLIATRYIQQQSLLLNSSVKQYSNELYQTIESQNSTLTHVCQFCQTAIIWFKNFLNMVKIQLTTLCILQHNYSSAALQLLISKIEQIYSEAKTEFDNTSTKVQELLQEINVDSQTLTTSKQQTIHWDFQHGCLPVNRCPEYLVQLISCLKESTNTLKDHRSRRGLTHNDEQIHKYERSQIKKVTDDIRIRLTTHCCPKAHDLYKTYQDWYKKALACRMKSLEIKTKLNFLIQSHSSFYQKLNDYLRTYTTLLEDNLSTIEKECDEEEVKSSNSNITDSSISVRRKVAGDILHGLKSSRSSVEEMVQLVKENNSIIEKFEALSSPEEWSQIT